jgi:hypothetical protein
MMEMEKWIDGVALRNIILSRDGRKIIKLRQLKKENPFTRNCADGLP